MSGLDFSALTDDQLVELVRECCREAVRRSPAASAAIERMMLDEAEKVRVAQAATATEAAAARARERMRIATEAAAAERARQDAAAAGERAAAARRAAEREAEAAQRRLAAEMALLRRVASEIGRQPAEISILHIRTRYGRRVMVNAGSDRFTRDHLVDYNADTRQISTKASLVTKKPDVIRIAAEIATHCAIDTFLVGASYPWQSSQETR